MALSVEQLSSDRRMLETQVSRAAFPVVLRIQGDTPLNGCSHTHQVNVQTPVFYTVSLRVVRAKIWTNGESWRFVSNQSLYSIFIYYICFSAQPRAAASYDVIMHVIVCVCLFMCLAGQNIGHYSSSVGYKLNFTVSVTPTCSCHRILVNDLNLWLLLEDMFAVKQACALKMDLFSF